MSSPFHNEQLIQVSSTCKYLQKRQRYYKMSKFLHHDDDDADDARAMTIPHRFLKKQEAKTYQLLSALQFILCRDFFSSSSFTPKSVLYP